MLETFSDTCGLTMFMRFLPSKKIEQSDERKSATTRLPLPTGAAVFPEVVGEPAERAVVGGVIVERALGSRGDDPGVDEPLQVVAQRRSREIDVALDVAGRGAARTGRDDETQDLQPDRVPERAQLLRVPFELRRHA